MKQLKQQAHRFAAFFMLIALILSLAIPAASYAAPTQTTTSAGSDSGAQPHSDDITVEYRFMGRETFDIPQTITRFGKTYRLISQDEPKLESTLPVTRLYTYRVSGTLTRDQLQQAQALGNLTLTPVLAARARQVEKVERITNLPNNDIDALPKTKTYEITDGASIGAVIQADLILAGVDYEVTGHDEWGLPNDYTATIHYRGQETYLDVSHYLVEAVYTNARTEDGKDEFIISATYEPTDPVDPTKRGSDTDGPIGESYPSEGGGEQETGQMEDPIPPLTAMQITSVGTGSILIVALIALLIYWTFFRNRRRKTEE
ncbi:MAG: hypothetical protein LBN36_03780 [Clostridiales Family XIII bacterium]|nr:hypothetical protein [Clostridiales Family XIII bacterium]